MTQLEKWHLNLKHYLCSLTTKQVCKPRPLALYQCDLIDRTFWASLVHTDGNCLVQAKIRHIRKTHNQQVLACAAFFLVLSTILSVVLRSILSFTWPFTAKVKAWPLDWALPCPGYSVSMRNKFGVFSAVGFVTSEAVESFGPQSLPFLQSFCCSQAFWKMLGTATKEHRFLLNTLQEIPFAFCMIGIHSGKCFATRGQ